MDGKVHDQASRSLERLLLAVMAVEIAIAITVALGFRLVLGTGSWLGGLHCREIVIRTHALFFSRDRTLISRTKV